MSLQLCFADVGIGGRETAKLREAGEIQFFGIGDPRFRRCADTGGDENASLGGVRCEYGKAYDGTYWKHWWFEGSFSNDSPCRAAHVHQDG